MKKQKYLLNLAGTRNGDIEFIRKVGSENGNTIWECKCHRCGKVFTISRRKAFYYFSGEGDRSLKCCVDCLPPEQRRPDSVRYTDSMLNSSMKVCKQCGKKFSVFQMDADHYVYKRGLKWFCSWGCMRAYDKVHGEPKYNSLK